MCHCHTVKVALCSSCFWLWDLWPFLCHAVCTQLVVGHGLQRLLVPGSCTGLGAAAVQRHASDSGCAAALLQPPAPCSDASPSRRIWCWTGKASCGSCRRPARAP